MTEGRIVIIGLGAVGRITGALLTEKGLECRFLDSREDHQDPVRYTCSLFPGTPGERAFPVTILPEDPREEAPALYLVTLKSWMNEEVLTALRPQISRGVPVVMMQNGMGNTETAAMILPENPVFPGVITAGAYRKGDLAVYAGGGCVRYDRPPILGDLSTPDLPWIRDPDLPRAMLLKLAANAVINPMTAVHNVRNGELLERADLQDQVKEITGEIYNICHAEDPSLKPGELEDYVTGVISATAGNISSMLADVRSGRRTEIRSIAGHLLARAREHGMDAPLLSSMNQAIRSLEKEHDQSTDSRS